MDKKNLFPTMEATFPEMRSSFSENGTPKKWDGGSPYPPAAIDEILPHETAVLTFH